MARSIFFVDTFYALVSAELGIDKVARGSHDYREMLGRALDYGFGTGAAYTRGLASLGWDTQLSIANSLGLQDGWAQENGVLRPWTRGWAYGPHLARLPIVNAVIHRFPHLHRMLLEQVKAAHPDVVVVQDLNLVPPALAAAIRKHTGLLVGEIASPLPPKTFVTSYDLIVSALPSIVDQAAAWGVASSWIPLGFDDRWTTTSPASERPIDVIFVGSFSRLQPQTVPLLRAVAEQTPSLRIYGPASPEVLERAGLARYYHGQAWGSKMFELLGKSRIVLNRHGSIAGPYAVNMRMYEATGSGAVLVTEQKENLEDLFLPREEVLAYTDPSDAAAQVADILQDPARLDRIAAAGQARTLGEHTYRHRAEALVEAIDLRLGAAR